jgi:hypothetical protein
VAVLELRFATVILAGVVIEEMVIGLVVFHARDVLQLLCPAAMVQLVDVRVPEILGTVIRVVTDNGGLDGSEKCLALSCAFTV